MNSPEACRKRLLKYVIPVFVLSIAFNVPKFLEAHIGIKKIWKHANGTEIERSENFTMSVENAIIDSEFVYISNSTIDTESFMSFQNYTKADIPYVSNFSPICFVRKK